MWLIVYDRATITTVDARTLGTLLDRLVGPCSIVLSAEQATVLAGRGMAGGVSL